MNKKISGRIVKGIGGFYYIKPADSDILIEAKPRGVFRHKKITPMVGDWVKLEEDNGKSTIVEIEERKNEFVRPPVANVDLAVIVFALTNPKPNFYLLDQLLVASEIKGVEPILCFTKTDLASEEEITKIKNHYKETGYPMLYLNSLDGTGLDELNKYLKNKTAFLAGPSGVGKSTLANRICDNGFMETGELSEKLKRGKHTTRHVELLELSMGGYLLDTPGFSSFKLQNEIDKADLKHFFPEFLQGACRFTSCTHRMEPGCEVKSQVQNGTVDLERYENYKLMYEQLEKDTRR